MTEAEARDILATFHESTIRWGYDGAMKDAVAALLSATRPAPGYIRTSEGCICDKMPRLASGEVAYPGMQVWCIRTARWGKKGESSEVYTDYDEPQDCIVHFIAVGGHELQEFGVIRQNMSFTDASLPKWCYSTRTAAEAAKREVGNG